MDLMPHREMDLILSWPLDYAMSTPQQQKAYYDACAWKNRYVTELFGSFEDFCVLTREEFKRGCAEMRKHKVPPVIIHGLEALHDPRSLQAKKAQPKKQRSDPWDEREIERSFANGPGPQVRVGIRAHWDEKQKMWKVQKGSESKNPKLLQEIHVSFRGFHPLDEIRVEMRRDRREFNSLLLWGPNSAGTINRQLQLLVEEKGKPNFLKLKQETSKKYWIAVQVRRHTGGVLSWETQPFGLLGHYSGYSGRGRGWTRPGTGVVTDMLPVEEQVLLHFVDPPAPPAVAPQPLSFGDVLRDTFPLPDALLYMPGGAPAPAHDISHNAANLPSVPLVHNVNTPAFSSAPFQQQQQQQQH